MPRAAASGEPWINFLTPDQVARLCAESAFSVEEDVGRREQVEPSLWERTDALTPHQMGRLVRAVAIRHPEQMFW